MRTLTTLLPCVVTALAQEALVLVGGKFGDGYVDNEVEVWSHSSDCGINIKNTPDFFIDRPGVAALENNLYVCGGRRIGTNSTSDDCDIYSLADNEWMDGPNQPFDRTDNDPFNYEFRFRMTTLGPTVVAAYQDHPEQEYQMSTLGEEGWSEPTSLGGTSNHGQTFLGLITLDEKHVALTAQQKYVYPMNVTIFIVNVETVTVVAEIPLDFVCYMPFLYNNQYTCVKVGSVNPDGAWDLLSLSFSEDFDEPTWTVVQSLPPDIFEFDMYNYRYFMTQMDGMLTGVFTKEAVIFYLEGDEWKSEEIKIPRDEPGHVVIPCPIKV